MAEFQGTVDDDSLVGSTGHDHFYLEDGGNDTAIGGDGFDSFLMGGAFTGDDRLDGGDSLDNLILDGDYAAGVVVGPDTLVGVEQVSLTAGHDYWLVFAGGDGPPRIETSGLARGERAIIDLSSAVYVDTGVYFQAGNGRDVLIGSDADDTFSVVGAGAAGPDKVKMGGGTDSVGIGNSFDSRDRIDGGAETTDYLGLGAGYAGGLTITQSMMRNIERIQVGGAGPAVFSLTIEDGVVKGGQKLSINSFDLSAGVAFDFHAEGATKGSFEVNGSNGDDTLAGGARADTLEGGEGDDVLTGGRGGDRLSSFGGGADRFVYLDIHDSLAAAPDRIMALASGDVIDLSAIDARPRKDGDQAFVLVDSLSGHAGEATLTYDGTRTTLTLDQAGHGVGDFLLHVDGDQTAFEGWVW